MKKILFTILAVFITSVLELHAQHEEKIYLKVIKEKDGKVIEEFDTVHISKGEGIYYLTDKGLHEHHGLDSILGEYKVLSNKGSRFIAISDKGQSCDSILNMYWNIHGEYDKDSLSNELWHFYRDKNSSKIKFNKGLTWIMDDSVKVIHGIHVDDEDGIIVLKSGKGENVEAIKKKLDKSKVWSIDSLDNLIGSGNNKLFIYSNDESTSDIFKDLNGKHKIIKEVIIRKEGESKENIEIIIGNVKSEEK